MENNLEQLIEMILEQEFLTKENEPIEFKIHEVSPSVKDNLNRGWIVHLIEAFVDGKEAGYIKISYIPDEVFDKEYPTVVQYLEKIRGNSLRLPKEHRLARDPSGPWEYVSDKLDSFPLWVQVYALDLLDWPYDLSNDKEKLKATPESELVKIKKNLIKTLEKRHKKEFADFKKFHKGKPLVDYIRVEPEFQRKRIGAALYEKAARWLAKRGLKLYASGLQSKQAQAAWDWMRKEKARNIGTERHSKDKERTFLSYLSA